MSEELELQYEGYEPEELTPEELAERDKWERELEEQAALEVQRELDEAEHERDAIADRRNASSGRSCRSFQSTRL